MNVAELHYLTKKSQTARLKCRSQHIREAIAEGPSSPEPQYSSAVKAYRTVVKTGANTKLCMNASTPYEVEEEVLQQAATLNSFPLKILLKIPLKKKQKRDSCSEHCSCEVL